MSDQFKQEVLKAFQKVSPSRINIEDDDVLKRYTKDHYTLFLKKLKFPYNIIINKFSQKLHI